MTTLIPIGQDVKKESKIGNNGSDLPRDNESPYYRGTYYQLSYTSSSTAHFQFIEGYAKHKTNPECAYTGFPPDTPLNITRQS